MSEKLGSLEGLPAEAIIHYLSLKELLSMLDESDAVSEPEKVVIRQAFNENPLRMAEEKWEGEGMQEEALQAKIALITALLIKMRREPKPEKERGGEES